MASPWTPDGLLARLETEEATGEFTYDALGRLVGSSVTLHREGVTLHRAGNLPAPMKRPSAILEVNREALRWISGGGRTGGRSL